MSVGAVSSIYYTPYIPAVSPAVGQGGDFAVDPSSLRADEATAAQATERPEANTFVDPADAAKFSRDFPQILMQQAFMPPITETQAPEPASEANAAATNSSLWQGDTARGDIATETPVEKAAETAAPDEGRQEEAAAVPGSEGEEEADDDAQAGEETNAKGEPMSEGEQRRLQELRNADREVRAHEQAHQAVGGQYAGGASYEFEQGPDGQSYAVAGEVSIDVSAESEPEATIAKLRQVRAAALAPAEPSGQDRSVAAAAQAAEMEAQGQLAEQQAAGAGETGNAGQTAAGTDGDDAGAVGETSMATPTRSGESGAPPGSGGGVASLQTNAFESAYRNRVSGAESPYGSRLMTDPVMASAMGYRPIDIVA
ncbi:MAG: hypothetical protein LBS30_04290 [Planctomycetota bacterium]|nr:hypothetical protein [Planctomycetota bacterium]